MKLKLLALAASAAIGLTATSALASTTITQNGESVTITATAQADLPGGAFSPTTAAPGFTMIDDFDSPVAAGFSVSGGNIIAYPGNPSTDAEPPGDTTSFESVEGNNHPFTLTDNNGALTAISFYMGSPDDYNGLTLTVNGALGPITLSGTQIWGGSPPGNGDQNAGFLVTYTFSPNSVHSLTFTSTTNSFEFDNLAGISVPEPATWALMIMGFGAAGATMRRRKALAA